MAISFDSDEQLGGSPSDVEVQVDGPGGATYTFDRNDFSESGSYTYALSTTQAYDDGDGTYEVNVTVAKDAAGNNGGTKGAGSGLTNTYDFSTGGGLPNAPYVNKSDDTHDPTTSTTLTIAYNATGEIASASDVGIEVIDSQGNSVVNDTLGSVGTKGTATLTVPGGTFSGDTQVTYRLLNLNTFTINGTDTSWLNATGGDTTAPTISSVTLSESSGDMAISFDSDEQLGTSASDVEVKVYGPGGATYTFDRDDFSEGGSYTYSLSTTQAYDAGDGPYGVNVTVAKDAAGNNGGTTGSGSGLTDTYDFSAGGGLPAAPYVNKSDDTYDSSTRTELTVTYNATGVIDQGDVLIQLLNGSTLIASNKSSSLPTEGTATLNFSSNPFGLSGDETVTYRLVNTSSTSKASDTSWLNDTAGADTTAPSIGNVGLSESSGNMAVTFDSNEQLGTSQSDVEVRVIGPGGTTYFFDRTDFSESGSGPYTYTLTTTQAYDDGDGFYLANVTVAKDAAGNNGGTKGTGLELTDSYDFTASSSLPAAYYINNSDRTHDPSTDTTLEVDFNATGKLTSTEIEIEVVDSQGTVLDFTSPSSTEGTVSLTVPAGTLSSDEQVTYNLVNTNTGGTETSDTSWLNESAGDTTAPSIANVNLSESSGNMIITFDSSEQLGVNPGDVAVQGLGPNGATYSFDRNDFSESGSGPYTYTLTATQAYDDGDGFYGINVTVAKDAAGNNGGTLGEGSGLTDSYDFSGGSSTTGTLNGTVTDANTTDAIDGATVTIIQDGSFVDSTTTDANGNYSLELDTGGYRVQIDATGYNKAEKPATISENTTTTLDAALDPKGPTGTLNGTVTDADTGDGIGGAFVVVLQSGQYIDSTTTQQDGTYTLDIETGTYDVTIEADGYSSDTTLGVTIDENKTTVVNANLTSSSSLGTISGTVTDSNGTAIENAQVDVFPSDGSFGGGRTTTDANGQYSISVDPTKKYDVFVDKSGFKAASTFEVSVDTGSTTTKDFQLNKTATGTLNGTITNQTGSAIDGVTVNVFNFKTFKQTKTDANGDYSFELSTGTYIMEVRKKGYVERFVRDVQVTDNGTTTKDFQLGQGATIKGWVNDSNGNNLQGVNVMLDGPDRQLTRTNSSGYYEVKVPAGNYTISAFSQQDKTLEASPDVSIQSGDTLTQNLTMISTSLTNVSVSYEGGPGNVNADKISAVANLQFGMIQVQLVNDNNNRPPGMPQDLEPLGVQEGDRFEINFTVEGYDPTTLLWGAKNVSWTSTQIAPNTYNISIETEALTMQGITSAQGNNNLPVGPLQGQDPDSISWPEGSEDTADIGWNRTVYFAMFDLSNVPSDRLNAVEGMTVATNAQTFSRPQLVETTVNGTTIEQLQVFVGGPNKTVDGNKHDGFYEAFIPDNMLDDWGVDDPESELQALYKGKDRNFNVTETSDGAWIELDISYSAGQIEVSATEDVVSNEDDDGETSGEANFEVTDLDVPDEAVKGEDATVTAEITNTGDADAERWVRLFVDGERVGGKSIWLSSGDSEVVEFTVSTANLDGDHEIEVGTDDDSATATMTVVESGEFELETLDPETLEVEPGTEQTVTATLTNTGESETSTTATLRVAGTAVDSVDVTLGPGETETVAFTFQAPDDVGEFTYSVTLEDTDHRLEGTLRTLEPAAFELGSLDPQTAEVEVGDEVTVSTTVANTGDVEETATAELVVSGQVVETKEVTLAGGASETVQFTFVPNQPGEYTHSVRVSGDEVSGDLTVVGTSEFDVDLVSRLNDVEPGEELTVRADVTNIGSAEGTTDVELRVDGQVVDTAQYTVGANSERSVEFTITAPMEPGDYSVTLVAGDVQIERTLTVAEDETPTPTETATPTDTPTDEETDTPTEEETDTPTAEETEEPTEAPTDEPTETATATEDGGDGGGPGFGLVTALLAVLFSLVARKRFENTPDTNRGDE